MASENRLKDAVIKLRIDTSDVKRIGDLPGGTQAQQVAGASGRGGRRPVPPPVADPRQPAPRVPEPPRAPVPGRGRAPNRPGGMFDGIAEKAALVHMARNPAALAGRALSGGLAAAGIWAGLTRGLPVYGGAIAEGGLPGTGAELADMAARLRQLETLVSATTSAASAAGGLAVAQKTLYGAVNEEDVGNLALRQFKITQQLATYEQRRETHALFQGGRAMAEMIGDPIAEMAVHVRDAHQFVTQSMIRSQIYLLPEWMQRYLEGQLR